MKHTVRVHLSEWPEYDASHPREIWFEGARIEAGGDDQSMTVVYDHNANCLRFIDGDKHVAWVELAEGKA